MFMFLLSIFQYKQTIKLPHETPGLCFAGEKVSLNEIAESPKLLKSLLDDTHDRFKIVLPNTENQVYLTASCRLISMIKNVKLFLITIDQFSGVRRIFSR